jgi:hypothetical protein
MNRLIPTIALIAFSSCVLAQSNREEVDLVQSVFGMEKKAIVSEFIKLDGAAGDAFWKAYDEYEIKTKDLAQTRLALLSKYIEGYTTLDDEKTEGIVKEMIALQSQTDKLIATYYRKIAKNAGVRPAAQFYQLEGYLLSKIRAEIMENIPVIGELDR